MLAINTAFMTANLALKAKNDVILKTLDAKSKHSENVLKTIDEMCGEANINILEVDALAVVVGPGSFTGLRIGAAIAQALGCVNPNLKFLALSSLELMAYIVVKNRQINTDFQCVINALSDKLFVCKFDKNGIKICEEQMIDKSDFDTHVKSFALKDDLNDSEFEYINFDSQSLLDFAIFKSQSGGFVSQEEMMPVYLRLSQAEDNLLKKS